MDFITSIKNTPNGTILVITDEEILGKYHEERNKQLDLAHKFYQGEKKSEQEVIALIDAAYILHLTGIKSVGLGIKLGLVEKGKIVTVKGIPHAEVVLDN